MNDTPKFNRPCRNEDCRRWRRADEVFCYRCYKALPLALQRMLWFRDGDSVAEWRGRIVLAQNWLDEHPEMWR